MRGEKRAKSFKQKDDHSQQRPTPLCLLDHNTELQSNKAGEEGGAGEVPNKPAAKPAIASRGKTIHTCRDRTSYSVDQGQSALGIS